MFLYRLLQADCIQLGAEELEPLKGMSCLQRLSLSGLGKLTDAILLQVGRKCVSVQKDQGGCMYLALGGTR